MRRLAVYASLLLMLAPARARADDLRDGVASPAMVPMRFIPPPTPQGIETAFWQEITYLERNQNASGDPDAGRVVAQIRQNLQAMDPASRLTAMTGVLEIAYHYQAQGDPASSARSRQGHEAELRAELAQAGEKAQQDPNSVYSSLFGELCKLAVNGPDGMAFRKLLENYDPANPGVERSLAKDYLETKDYTSALAASQKAVGLDPGNAQAYTTMAGAKFALRDFYGAHEAARAALDIQPQDQVAYSILKLTEDNVRLKDVGKTSPEGFSPQPGSYYASVSAELESRSAGAPPSGGTDVSRALTASAEAEFSKGNFSAAQTLAARAAQADPGNATALYWSAQSNMRSDRLTRALADVDRAEQLFAGRPSPALLLLRAEILNRLRRHGEALEAADQGLALNPQNIQIKAELFFQKAWALAGLRRMREAAEALKSAAHLDSRFETYYQALLALPEDTDPTSLFDGTLQFRRHTWNRAPRAGSRLKSMLTVVGSSLLGGLLIALGLMSLGSSNWSDRLKGVFSPSPEKYIAPEPPLLTGSSEEIARLLAGNFRINRKLGVGGMGVVYEAFDQNLERRVAIKKLRPEISSDPRARERILQEARTVAQLKHPNIVEIYSVLVKGADVYLIFEFIDGRTLHEHIQTDIRLSFDQALGVLRSVASALDYAHSRDIIHRDLKPGNIMIESDGAVKVMDFGVARQTKDSLRRDTNPGTPQYMAPEQEAGNPRKESDVYAMGVTLYEMVTGQLPFSGTNSGISLSKMNGAYVPPSEIASGLPPHFDRVLSWALAPDPNKRWRNASQFVRNLELLVPPQTV